MEKPQNESQTSSPASSGADDHYGGPEDDYVLSPEARWFGLLTPAIRQSALRHGLRVIGVDFDTTAWIAEDRRGRRYFKALNIPALATDAGFSSLLRAPWTPRPTLR